MLRQLRKSPVGLLGFILVLFFVITAVFAPLLTSYDPAAQVLMDKLISPFASKGGTIKHLLGTDQLGRDELSRVLYGGRISLFIALSGTVLSCIIGTILGAVAGFYGKWVDAFIGRIIDIQLSFPFILLAIFVMSVLGSGVTNIIIVAGISGWVQFARVVRGEMLAIKQIEYVEAIRSLGGRDSRMIFRHILPNITSQIIVIATLEIAKVVLMESSLSYLGMGVPPEVPTWGRMLAESKNYMGSSPHLAVVPGIFICLLVLGVNLFGDWLRDYLDPRLDKN